MTTQNYRLISFNLCPFVQRSVITLREKNIAYEIEYIDLGNKPDWFHAISPRGKVPVLDLGDVALFESAVISEFIDETSEGRLMPEDAIARAQHRAWIAVAGDLNGPAYMMMVSDEETTRTAASNARDELEKFEKQLGAGPFFDGEDFSLVDAAIAPPLQRLRWIENVESFDLFEGLPKVDAWTSTLMERSSVQGSIVDDAESIFAEYIMGKGSPTRNETPGYLGNALRAQRT